MCATNGLSYGSAAGRIITYHGVCQNSSYCMQQAGTEELISSLGFGTRED